MILVHHAGRPECSKQFDAVIFGQEFGVGDATGHWPRNRVFRKIVIDILEKYRGLV